MGRADGYIGRGRGWYFSALPELNERKWHWRNADQGESAEVQVCVQRSRLFAEHVFPNSFEQPDQLSSLIRIQRGHDLLT